MEASAEEVQNQTQVAPAVKGAPAFEGAPGGRFFPLFLILVGVLVRLPFVLSTGAVLWPDSIQYYNAAAALIERGTFARVSIYHTPLYPLFLSFFFFSGRTPAAGAIVLAVQHLVGIGTVLLLYQAGKKITGRTSAFIASLLLSVHPLLLYYERVIQTEILFVFLCMVLFAVLQRLFSAPSVRSAAVCGMAAALVTLTRPVALCLPVVFAFLVIFKERRAGNAVILLLVYTVILAPWVFYNHHQRGFWGVSQGAGVNLFLKVYEVAGIKPVENSSYLQVKRIYENLRSRQPDDHVYWGVRKILYGRTRSEARTDTLMLRFAVEGLMSDPLPYLSATLRHFSAFFFDARNSVNVCNFEKGPVPCAVPARRLTTRAFPFVDGAGYPALSSSAARFLSGFRFPMSILVLASVYGAWALWREAPCHRFFAAAVISTALYFALAVSSLNMPEDRYRLPLDPMFFLFGVYGAFHLLQNIVWRCRAGEK